MSWSTEKQTERKACHLWWEATCSVLEWLKWWNPDSQAWHICVLITKRNLKWCSNQAYGGFILSVKYGWYQTLHLQMWSTMTANNECTNVNRQWIECRLSFRNYKICFITSFQATHFSDPCQAKDGEAPTAMPPQVPDATSRDLQSSANINMTFTYVVPSWSFKLKQLLITWGP